MAVGNGDLVVRELSWSDMGMFKCVARNEFGEDMREAFVYPLAPATATVTSDQGLALASGGGVVGFK